MAAVRMRQAVCLSLLALAACGGGGGGEVSDGSGSDGGAGVSGLVPAAPTAGAVLYADARTLRPIQEGAKSSYRGFAIAGPGATPVAYLTATTQSAVSATDATETLSNTGNTGAGTSQLSVAGGRVGSAESVDFAGKGVAQPVVFIELRSPVRQSDQYTILDQHYADTSIDADGDGKADALDVAIYARVAGAETLSLPNLPTMQAVRVDATVLSRVTFSSNGQTSTVAKATLQTWYAAGIGIVRQTSSVPSAGGSGDATSDEQITARDGISTGLGAMPPVAAVVPAGAAAYAGQDLVVPTSAINAFAFGDHALVFSQTPDNPTADMLASVVDLRGNVSATTVIAGMSAGAGRAVALPNGVVVVGDIGGGAITDFSLTRIDAHGALVGALRGVTLSLGGSHVSAYVTQLVAAADDTTLWLLWARNYYDPGNGAVPSAELVLRPYSFDGVALAPERIVDDSAVHGLQLSAAGGRMLMVWERAGPPYDVRLGAASLLTLGPINTLVAGVANSSFVTPLALGANGALLWPQTPGLPIGSGVMGGVLLDTNLLPISAGASLLDDDITGVPAFSMSTVAPSALGSRIVFTSTVSDKLWPDINSNEAVDSVSWLDAGAAPLAGTPINTVRLASVGPKAQVLFSDRVLVFGASASYRLSTTVVWLNKGTTP